MPKSEGGEELVRGQEIPSWSSRPLAFALGGENVQCVTVSQDGQAISASFVSELSEEELADPNRYDWQEGEALWEETLGNGLWHPYSQVTDYYVQHGEKQSALHLQEVLLAEVRRTELPPETLGVAIYNQACFFARNGWPEKAIQQLPEALRLRPTLIEWSQHDSDFDEVRANPAFQEIFQDPGLLAKAPVSSLVSPQELHASSSSEQPPIVIDVRGPSEYAAGHVQGAINISLGQLSRKLKQIPRDRPVVTYCNMHHRGESRGERAAALLREHGYQAQTIDGGYPAWKEASFPVVEASQG